MTAMELMESVGRMEEELIEPVLTPPAKKRLSRPIRTALILAAVIALLALLGVAAKETGFLERLFPEKFETIEEYVNHIAATTENDSLRLTLHEAVTDGYTIILVYSVERLDGGSMEGWIPDDIIQARTKEGYPAKFGASSGEELDMGDRDPARRTYVWYNNGPTSRGRISLRLFGLKNRETGETFAPGYLVAEAELKPSLTKIARRHGDAAGEKIYTDMVLSPFGFRTNILRNIAGMTEEDAPEQENSAIYQHWQGSLQLLYRNGEEKDMTGLTVRSVLQKAGSAEGLMNLSVVFGEPTDIREVRAVRLDGAEYPVETGPIPGERLVWDVRAPYLEQNRTWLYGDHVPAHPELAAEGPVFTLAVDGIWTDGYAAEVMLAAGYKGDEPLVRENATGLTVDHGGIFAFEALDAKGTPVPVGVYCGGSVNELFSFAVECAERAETLVIHAGETTLTIPLDMKQLRKLPQITPQEPRERVLDPEQQAENRRNLYDSLFRNTPPTETDYAADNGIYRLEIRSLYLRGSWGEGRLRAWAVGSALTGDYDESVEMYAAITGFQVCVLSGGKEILVSSAGGSGGYYDAETGERVFTLDRSLKGDFDTLDAVRLIWTPPAGDRIALDLEPTAAP